MKNSLEAALEAICDRSDAITAAMGDEKASAIFASPEREKTWKVNAALLQALATIPNMQILPSLCSLIDRVEARVYAANHAVIARIGGNSNVVTGFVNAQQTFFHLLKEGDPTVRVLAGAAVDHLKTVRSIMLAMYTEIHHQLKVAEGVSTNPLLRSIEKIVNGVGDLLGKQIADTFERYAEGSFKEMRLTRNALVRVYQAESISIVNFKGPRTKEKREQVIAVMRIIASTPGPSDLHEVCTAVFKPIKGGYLSAHDLYLWCYRNKAKVKSMVEELRNEAQS